MASSTIIAHGIPNDLASVNEIGNSNESQFMQDVMSLVVDLKSQVQDLQEKKEKESKVRLILQLARDILSVGFNIEKLHPRLLLIMLYFHYR